MIKDKYIDKFKDVAIEACLGTGEFILSRLGKVTQLEYKGKINLVTDVDKKAEELIIKKINKNFPTVSILAEETGRSNGDSDLKCLIDPLDGTTNFAHGFPIFGISIALEENKIPVLGVVYIPYFNELFFAQKGKGAFLNKRRIRVSNTGNLSESLLATGFAYNFKHTQNNNIDNFVNFLMASQAVRRAGSAAVDLCYVACGRFDGFWELNLHPWDTAAGSIIVAEAGGRVTQFNGKFYSHYDNNILASNGKIHTQMIRILRLSQTSSK